MSILIFVSKCSQTFGMTREIHHRVAKLWLISIHYAFFKLLFEVIDADLVDELVDLSFFEHLASLVRVVCTENRVGSPLSIRSSLQLLILLV